MKLDGSGRTRLFPYNPALALCFFVTALNAICAPAYWELRCCVVPRNLRPEVRSLPNCSDLLTGKPHPTSSGLRSFPRCGVLLPVQAFRDHHARHHGIAILTQDLPADARYAK
jgi:hypothetical protein